MKALELANLELVQAELALRELTQPLAAAFDAATWRSLLNHLEKCWVKTGIAGRPLGRVFQSFNAPYRAERTTDELLRYLSQARHADQHSSQPLVQRDWRRLSRWLPANLGRYELVALPLANRGVTYAVPTTHIGYAIGEPTAQVLGTLGCRYYRRYLERASAVVSGAP